MHKVKSNGTVKELVEVNEAPKMQEDIASVDLGVTKGTDDVFLRFTAKDGTQKKLTFSYKNGIFLYDSVSGNTKSIRWPS